VACRSTCATARINAVNAWSAFSTATGITSSAALTSKKKWLEHLYPIFTEAEHIYLTTLSSKKERGTLYKRLQRLKADFARLELETGELVVFSSQNPDGVELPQSIRNGVLKVAMDAATFRHKPITTSRGWKLPPKKNDSEDSQWERVGGLPTPSMRRGRWLKSWG